MKKFYIFLTVTFIGLIGNAQIVNIPDVVFKAKLVASTATSSIARNLAGNMIKVDTNNNGEIEVSETVPVSSLYVVGSPNPVNSFEGIQAFTNLRSFTSNLNNTPTLNLSGLPLLNYLDCNSTHIVSLNLSGCTALNYISCSLNSIASLDLSDAAGLQALHIEANPITTLDLSNHTSLHTLKAKQSQLATVNLGGCTQLNDVDVSGNPLTSLNVSGLTSLVILKCENGGVMESINLTGCNLLQMLYAANNNLTSLNLTGLNALKYLDASGNEIITIIHPTALPNLETFYCSFNQINSLDLTGMTGLKYLYCQNNPMTNLNLAGMSSLLSLNCNNTLLTSLDFTNMTALQSLNADGNPFVTIDVNPCLSLSGAAIRDCPNLIQIFAKNGRSIYLNVNNDVNLQYVCTDNGSQVVSNSTPTWHTNSYCSFTPGGTFYTMQGSTKFDSNNNGCDINDAHFSNLKMSFTKGSQVAVHVPDSSGNYHYEVQSGTYTIAPIFENENYFNVSPATAIVTFPTQTSPFTQNFCITPNGSHPDLEITVIPIGNAARPGFDASYKLIYKNKGNQQLSGTVDLTFDDAVSDFVSAQPSVSSQNTNHLAWDFTNLDLHETREILVILNLNTPMETPALNGGDVLHYTASVALASDETPADNTSVFHQVLVNSLDPNDKTCIEGTTITPSMVGQYLHYVIRFENTGTANAENIVVKDMIDIYKFDISSIVPLSASHPYVTRIINNNQVEFIFENINLPFDDANNDGYVAFKIKTLPNLIVGDTFSNSANIYFDYNFPIVTNNFTTTVQTLSTQDFDFNTYFSVYPNPASNELNIERKETIEIKSINIYNILGQIIIAIPNAESVAAIDLSDLKTGTYFIKVNTDKGNATTTFIKN